jgi:hypothetical protein
MPGILCRQVPVSHSVAICLVTVSFHRRVTIIIPALAYAVSSRVVRTLSSPTRICCSPGPIVLTGFAVSGMTIPGIVVACPLASYVGIVITGIALTGVVQPGPLFSD